MEHLSKNAQVLKYFAERCPGGIPRTRLVKLVYLADLEARKLLGHPISDFEYIWHHHGPFDKVIFEAITELVNAELAERRYVQIDANMTEKRLQIVGGKGAFGFSLAEKEILSHVAERYMETPLKELLDDVVYQTPPMKSVSQKGERLPMEDLDNQDKNRIGFDLEEVLAAEQEADLGRFMLAGDFFNALRVEVGGAGTA